MPPWSAPDRRTIRDIFSVFALAAVMTFVFAFAPVAGAAGQRGSDHRTSSHKKQHGSKTSRKKGAARRRTAAKKHAAKQPARPAPDVPATGTYSDRDFDGDGFSNPRDNCPLVVNGDQADANGNGIGDGCEGQNRNKTIDALRNVDGQPRFDEIFRFLAQNKTVMPGWDIEAKGWVRIAPNAGDVDRLVLQRALMNIWQGKHWYTHADGGTIYNRMFDDRQAWNHRVYWTTSILDDKPAIGVDAAPVPGIDNIRLVQPGIYLGITMTDGVKPIWGPDSGWTVPRAAGRGMFILSFEDTAITPEECPACTPHDHEGP
jgi:hypothetical protein